jgi:hypothetical protein
MLSRISQIVPTTRLQVADCNSDKELIDLWLHDKTLIPSMPTAETQKNFDGL